MQYVTFINKAGIEHKAWARKEGDKFVCMKLEDLSSTPENMWPQKIFNTQVEADEAILKYVNAGLKAGIFVSKRVE